MTHPNSKYFVNANHSNFNRLIKDYKANSFRIQSNDLFLDEDISRVQVYSQLVDICVLLKSMIIVRVNIIRNSKSYFFQTNLRSISLILYIFVSLLFKFFLALFNLRFYQYFRNNLIRQSNISASHLTSMKQSLESGESFVLILEDDFLINDMEAIMKMLK